MKMYDADSQVAKLEAAQNDLLMRGQIAAERNVAKFALQVVYDEPTVDAEPVRHGRCDTCDIKENGRGSIELYGNDWLMYIRQQGATYDMIINHCGDQISIPIEFCPDCGAKMGGGAEDAQS